MTQKERILADVIRYHLYLPRYPRSISKEFYK
jgi:hypothetical protein